MIAVILVNYNSAYDTIECIESVKKSKSDQSIIIIVVDNMSTDDSRRILENHRKKTDFKLIVAKENRGFSGGNNIGIEYALKRNVEYIVLLNNDTCVDTETLSILVEKSQMHRDSAVLTPKIMIYNSNKIWYAGGAFSQLSTRVVHTGYNEIDTGKYNIEKPVSFISGCCMFIPQKIVKAVGPLDESFFLYCEDVEYCQRITKNEFELLYIPDAKIYHKVSLSTKKSGVSQTYYTVRNKLILASRYNRGLKLCISYMYLALECVSRIIKREYDCSAVRVALIDFARGKKGKPL